MRWTQTLLTTLRDAPAEAEIASHQLLLRAGLARKLTSGLYTFLPLGLRALRKVERIVREEMDRAGGLEILMPALQPPDLWEKSGRIQAAEDVLFHVKDHQDRRWILGPTHEEVVTSLVAGEVQSYRQLPRTLYQIQTKYRDEIRPRFGLMRAREFIMKDAYSFDTDETAAKKSYGAMVGAYRRIFERVGLDALQVEADTGVMGGASSHEFCVVAEIGEGELVTEEGGTYAAAIEKAEGKPAERSGVGGIMEKFPTPGIRTIADLEKKHGVLAQDQVKTLVFTNGKETILVLVRGDDEAQETKVGKVLGAGFRAAVDTEIKEAMGASPGSLGAVASTLAAKKVTVVADFALRGQTGMTTGANDNGFHFKGVDVERDLKIDTWADVRKVRQGDLSSGSKKLNVSRGIEVGHAFLLGTKYSVALEAKFLDPQGKQQPAVMGCYGIGVTRTLQAVIEVHQDKDGIRWPAAVAPYTVMLVTLDLADPAVQSATDAVIASLEKAGIDYLWDDRDERPGVKFKDADLLGFPWRVTIGAKSVAKGGVEVKCRKTGAMEMIPPAEVGSWVQNKLKS
ncbi:MAG: proline--tRNA ligase [Verrucomicrobia bacterium]|nr:proline--tRNA ligase [Verrucomicrobiota bacterium]